MKINIVDLGNCRKQIQELFSCYWQDSFLNQYGTIRIDIEIEEFLYKNCVNIFAGIQNIVRIKCLEIRLS